jgi:hypothetical protein
MDSPHTHHSELELVAEYPGVLTIRAWKNIGLCTWSGAAVAPVVATLVEATEKLRSPGRRVSFVHLIPDKLALPDAEARSAFIRLMKDYQSDLACIAIVVGGTGFWASAMRNAIIGLRVFAPRSFEFRLHGSVEEVVEWLPAAHRKLTDVEIPPATLERLLAQAMGSEPSVDLG